MDKIFFWRSEKTPKTDAAEMQRLFENEMFRKFPLYSEFEYMGVTCMVVSHQRFSTGVFVRGNHHGGTDAAIHCNYVCKNGLIHRASFDLSGLNNLGANE